MVRGDANVAVVALEQHSDGFAWAEREPVKDRQ
jgi:hypothetical protein